VFKYAIRKLLLALPLIWGVITLIFFLVELSPGTAADKYFNPDTTPDTRDMIIEKYQLDAPGYVRYIYMLRNLVMLDFGVSMATERPVFDMIMDAAPNTIVLSLITLAVLYPTGILLGTVQAVRHGKAADTGISVGSLFFYSMPSFWLALMLQLIVSYWLGDIVEQMGRDGMLPNFIVMLFALPAAGMYDAVEYDYMTTSEQLFDRFRHLILPGVAMGLAFAASTARYMRSSLLEVIRQDYIRTARAKGLPERRVVLKHAMRNAIMPIVTLVGLSLPALFTGAVLTEHIFAWPGMGRLILDAVYGQDTPLIIGCFFVIALLVVAGNLVADLSYAVVDPRVKYD
jgi:peptide/nickel transport system permease protein